jgi:hypothetical protein
VVLWSAASVASDWVIGEASEGKERQILVPVLIESVRPQMDFRSIQTADLAGWRGDSADPAFRTLCQDILARIRPASKPAPEHAPPGKVEDRFAEHHTKAAPPFMRRWLMGGAVLAMVICAGLVVYTVTTRHAASVIPKAPPSSTVTQQPPPQVSSTREQSNGGSSQSPGRSSTILFSGLAVLKGTWSISFETGEQGGLGDVWWDQKTPSTRSMAPKGGSRIVNLGLRDFDSITPDSLIKLNYSMNPIIGDDDSNQLIANDVFAVLTSHGNYAKVKVLTPGYDIKLQWTTYHFN